MTNYEILKKRDMLAEMEERLNEDCRCCVNYERCGYPASKPSKEACKEMWRSFFDGANTPKKLAIRMSKAHDCDECPVHGMCGEIKYFYECEDTIIAWLRNENLLYDIAIGKK
mgnify:FL=1